MAFPTTGILDSGVRTNEDPISLGGAWTSPSFGDTNGFRIVSNEIHPNASTFSGSLWNDAGLGADQETYITVNAVQTGTSAYIFLAERIVNPGSSFSGYEMKIPCHTGSPYTWTLYKITNGVQGLLNTWTQQVSAGDLVGYELIGTSHQPYYKASGGSWAPLGSPWTDGTFTATGKVGLEGDVDAPGQKFVNFGGGTVVTGATHNKVGAAVA